MKCKAKETGWFGGRIVNEGKTFEAKLCPNWATPVKIPKAEPEPESKEMITLREKAKDWGYASLS